MRLFPQDLVTWPVPPFTLLSLLPRPRLMIRQRKPEYCGWQDSSTAIWKPWGMFQKAQAAKWRVGSTSKMTAPGMANNGRAGDRALYLSDGTLDAPRVRPWSSSPTAAGG